MLTGLREEEAKTFLVQSCIGQGVTDLLSADKSGEKSTLQRIAELEKKYMDGIEMMETKAEMSKSLHEMVEAHLKKLETAMLSFEEEIRLARQFGDLDNEDELTETASTASLTTASVTKDEPDQEQPKLTGSGVNKRKSKDETTSNASRSPRRAESGEFDKIPSSKRSRRSADEPSTSVLGNASSSISNSHILHHGHLSKSPEAAVEPTYCYCNQVSFGEMVGCDNPECSIEWFHYPCVGLAAPPPGKWFCPDCVSIKEKQLDRNNNETFTRRSSRQPTE